MTPTVKRLTVQAVIRYLNGDTEQFMTWANEAAAEYKRETERNRLHATIGEILQNKDVRLWNKLQAIDQ